MLMNSSFTLRNIEKLNFAQKKNTPYNKGTKRIRIKLIVHKSLPAVNKNMPRNIFISSR